MYFSDTSNLSMNSAKKQIFSILNHIEEVIIVSMFALMVIIIFVQVIMRKAGNSLSWSEELGKFLFVWISWMGISLGQREGEHIKITMLTDRLPFRLAQIVNIISDIVVIIICAVISTMAWNWWSLRAMCPMLASRSAPPGATWRWCWAAD